MFDEEDKMVWIEKELENWGFFFCLLMWRYFIGDCVELIDGLKINDEVGDVYVFGKEECIFGVFLWVFIMEKSIMFLIFNILCLSYCFLVYICCFL